MTLGSANDDDDKKDVKQSLSSSSGAIMSSNYSMPLLYTLICILLVWIIN